MDIINRIRVDIANPACLGFFFECDGNSVSVSKRGSNLHATYESWNGTQKVVENEGMAEIESHIAMIHEMDPYGTYCPSFKPTKWSDHKIKQFIEDIQPHLFDYCFRGFELKADGVPSFVVRKNPDGFNPWIIDGKGGDLVDVLTATRAKLNEEVYWECAIL